MAFIFFFSFLFCDQYTKVLSLFSNSTPTVFSNTLPHTRYPYPRRSRLLLINRLLSTKRSGFIYPLITWDKRSPYYVCSRDSSIKNIRCPYRPGTPLGVDTSPLHHNESRSTHPGFRLQSRILIILTLSVRI